jgi:hypothetical protein
MPTCTTRPLLSKRGMVHLFCGRPATPTMNLLMGDCIDGCATAPRGASVPKKGIGFHNGLFLKSLSRGPGINVEIQIIFGWLFGGCVGHGLVPKKGLLCSTQYWCQGLEAPFKALLYLLHITRCSCVQTGKLGVATVPHTPNRTHLTPKGVQASTRSIHLIRYS